MILSRLLVLFIALAIIDSSCNGQKQGSLMSPPYHSQHLCTMMGKIEPDQRITGESTLLWPKNRIEVYFMDDDGQVRDRVLAIANAWRPFSGVQFVRSFDQNTSDIRVSFRTDGWWSYIGTMSAEVGKDSATLSLDSLYLYPSAKFRSIVLHEFGHSLGLLHEHQNPSFKINWDFTALYKYYKDEYNVDTTWVKENVIQKYESSTGIYCEPDIKSIMLYKIPPGLTKNAIVAPEPLDLSVLDKKYIRIIYAGGTCN